MSNTRNTRVAHFSFASSLILGQWLYVFSTKQFSWRISKATGSKSSEADQDFSQQALVSEMMTRTRRGFCSTIWTSMFVSSIVFGIQPQVTHCAQSVISSIVQMNETVLQRIAFLQNAPQKDGWVRTRGRIMNSPSVSQFRQVSGTLLFRRPITQPYSSRPWLVVTCTNTEEYKTPHSRLLAVLPSVAFVIKLSSASSRYRIFFTFGGMVYERRLFWGFGTHS